MTDPIILDDTEALLVGAIKAALGDGTPVATRHPSGEPPRYVRLSRVGGPAVNPFIDSPMVTIECWADNDGAAYDLCKAVRAEIHALDGKRVNDARISGLIETGGPAYFPDPDSPNYHRYQFTVKLDVRWFRPRASA